MSQLDISQILEEAKIRWLRPSEVCEIIRNYQSFHLKPDPPYKPAGGSLFLFDRKTLRYFRKDGHQWRKKKDGKTIREAHEKLKSGSVDVLHCYYAHGEENENFQRRSYWMLDGLLEHIVLVHYREVNEGGTPQIADFLLSPDSGFRARSWGHHGGGHPSYGSSPSPLGWSEHAPSSEVDDVDSGRGFGAPPLGEAFAGCGYGMAPTCEDVASDLDDGRWSSFPVAQSQVPQADFCNECVEGGSHAAVYGVFVRAFRNSDADRPLTADTGPRRGFGVENEAIFAEDDSYSVRRMNGDDGFWGWMRGEMGQVCDVPAMAAKDTVDCCWNSMDAQNEEDLEISSLSRELYLDLGSPGPWLAQEQLFSIVDYSPDWAYSGGQETKVLISGSFLGEAQRAEVRWSCMFGEVEVPAEVLSPNALRCYAPYLSPGRVPLYVTRSNRLACSEIREFEYRPGGESSFASPMSEGERANIQVRFARIVLSDGGCADCAAPVEGFSSFKNDPRETLIQTLLGCRLREWLLMKSGEDGKGTRVLDEHGQGALHLAAALGYDWAVKSIVTAGVSPNFRDARGWTPLHWAAYAGREETVMTLVTLGSSPSAVADPTAEDPQGRTAADVASSRGHKGISGYLAEADLTDQLSTLDLADRFCGQPPAEDSDARGRQRETIRAVQFSSEAAARIRSALGGESLRRWGPSDGVTDDEDVACAVSSRLFRGKVNDGLRVKAAERIQHKYRGWSGRREFLKMRRRIVKIQAHVRGHQVRRQYKKFLWSVGIVEKAILRWRRRGRGLRGFRGIDADGVAGEEYDFLAEARMQKAAGVERALARVQSMARRPEGRVQYMRMVAARRISSFRHDDADMSLNCHRQEQNDAALSNWATR